MGMLLISTAVQEETTGCSLDVANYTNWLNAKIQK